MRPLYSDTEFAELFKTLTVDQKQDFIAAYDRIILPCVVANDSQKNDMALYLLKRLLGIPCGKPQFSTARMVRQRQTRKKQLRFEDKKREWLEKLCQ